MLERGDLSKKGPAKEILDNQREERKESVGGERKKRQRGKTSSFSGAKRKDKFSVKADVYLRRRWRSGSSKNDYGMREFGF